VEPQQVSSLRGEADGDPDPDEDQQHRQHVSESGLEHGIHLFSVPFCPVGFLPTPLTVFRRSDRNTILATTTTGSQLAPCKTEMTGSGCAISGHY
jgi:hypothetical protein